jgi:prepilin-type N-terminal cleavage/methylation domain-containing protein
MTRGFTLVEVVLAVALSSFVGLVAGGLLHSAARSAREAEFRERTLWIAASVLDSLRRQEAWSAGDLSLPQGHRVRWSPGPGGGEVEVWLRDETRAWLVLPVGATSSAAPDRTGPERSAP